MARIQQSPGLQQPFESIFPQPIISKRSPTANDKNYPIGQLWVDTTSKIFYGLSEVASGVADWEVLGGSSSSVDSLDGDTGSASPTGGAITIAGGDNIVTSATASTLTVSLDTDISVDSVDAADSLRAEAVIVDGDEGTGVASTVMFTNVVDEDVSSGVGTVLMKTANAGDSSGWLKIYSGTDVRYIPYWTDISPS